MFTFNEKKEYKTKLDLNIAMDGKEFEDFCSEAKYF